MVVRVAVIGAGIMGQDHARILAQDIPGATLQIVCDVAVQSARKVADTYGAADVCADPIAAIQDRCVDAVLIASPDATHADLTLEAIRLGKPVLCEKPLAMTPQDSLKVVQAECAHGRRLVQVGFMRRFDPSYCEMKSALDQGMLGRALMMHNFHRNMDSPGAWFTGDMAITNSASHEFDAARYVLGTDFTTVAAYQPRRGDDATAPVMMVLETADGQIVNIEINNNASYGYDVRGELVGELGSVFLNAPVTARYNLGLRDEAIYPADWRPRFAEAYRLQNKAWLRAIQESVPAPSAATAWDGYCACLVAQTATRALGEGRALPIR